MRPPTDPTSAAVPPSTTRATRRAPAPPPAGRAGTDANRRGGQDALAGRSAGWPPAGGAADRAEDGSLVTEYGLVTVVGATVAGVMLRWAGGGAVTDLLGGVLARVRELVGV